MLDERGPFRRAISVGSGTGTKELNLLERGVVGHFDLFDLAASRMQRAREHAAAKNIEDRATFNTDDAFARLDSGGGYDLVYWNSSLHHMADARAAVEWSWRQLGSGGLFAMWEFVGPTRFQWSDRNLETVRRLRAALPDHLRINASRDRWSVVRASNR